MVYQFSIPRSDIWVSIFDPSYGVKIDRKNFDTFRPIAAKLPKWVKHLYMPKPTQFNAKVVEPPDFWESFNVGRVKVHQGVLADGCIIPPKSAFAVTSADCPTIVAYGNDINGHLQVVAAHAGRDSLVKGTDIMSMSDKSVVANAVGKLTSAGVPAKKVHMHIYCGIRTGFTHPLDHPQYGAKNRRLFVYANMYKGAIRNEETCEIDLYELIRGQAMDCDVLPKNVVFDDVDTGADKRWASTSREPGTDKRNLVIVCRG